MDFTDFINNETIAGKDLVAWVTAGFLHIPHAEDIPNMVTVGNSVGFFLRPCNFFDEDSSINSADSIYFCVDQDAGSCHWLQTGPLPPIWCHGLCLYQSKPCLEPQSEPCPQIADRRECSDLLADTMIVMPTMKGHQRKRCNLGPDPVDETKAQPSDSCVLSVEVQLSPKPAALAHLDRGSPPPAREALAIIFFGRQPQPNVTELMVDHKALDPAQWTIQKVLFQSRYYDSLAQLKEQFEAGWVNVVVIPDDGTERPYRATYMDCHFLVESQAPKTPHDAFGVFKQNKGLPLRYGNQVGEHTLGPVHTHSAHYKVDLDVGVPLPPKLKSCVWAEDMAFVPMMVPWSPEHQMLRLQVTQKQLETEEQAAFPLGGASPHYLYLASNQSKKWRHPHSYRIKTVSFAGGPMPQNSSTERVVGWGRVLSE
ncbi:hypothetical protein E5288_WYG011738 [Bos mutus]|uniref:Amine oxidase n=1 Tax=Bos mutus TaxID=72004 RepID=A0A6B0SDR1_9CETA|nr:hypothetical protein [Bos mutus]